MHHLFQPKSAITCRINLHAKTSFIVYSVGQVVLSCPWERHNAAYSIHRSSILRYNKSWYFDLWFAYLIRLLLVDWFPPTHVFGQICPGCFPDFAQGTLKRTSSWTWIGKNGHRKWRDGWVQPLRQGKITSRQGFIEVNTFTSTKVTYLLETSCEKQM